MTGSAWPADRLGAGLKAGARKSRYSGRAAAYAAALYERDAALKGTDERTAVVRTARRHEVHMVDGDAMELL